MEHNPDNHAENSTRPNSSYTIESTFADSAVDMRSSTPTPIPEDDVFKHEPSTLRPSLPPSPEPVDQRLSDKMRHLTATAWTLEQDTGIDAKDRERIRGLLNSLEHILEAEDEKSEDVQQKASPFVAGDHNLLDQKSVSRKPEALPVDEDEDEWIDEADLLAVRDNLTATVQSMRFRQQEQRHLHELTLHKLEAVAQRCLAQERQLQDLARSVNDLREENQTLGEDNDRLKTTAAELESEVTRKEVAVSAMSSAVAGLEGWLESTQESSELSSPRISHGRRQRVVVRGKGRFRGKYVVEDDGLPKGHEETGVDSRELHDGVRAWVRGFRDVEEELRQSHAKEPGHWTHAARNDHGLEDEDWGEFERPGTYPS